MNVSITEGVIRFQARYMRTLIQQLPLNEYGLPTGLWDPSLIAQAATTETGSEVDVTPSDEAWIELNYQEGFPTVGHTSIPFWEKLPSEPLRFFAAFARYLAQKGARNLYTLALDLREAKDFEGAPSLETLRSVFDLYYWEYRAKAFDLFERASRERYRTVKAVEIEARHSTMSEDLVTKALKFLEKKFTEGTLNAREVIEVLKMSIGLERISIGLPAGGVKQGEERSGNSDFKAILASITVNATTVHTSLSSHELLSKALADPETAALAQQLALRISDSDPQVIPVDPQSISSSASAESDVSDILAGKPL